MEYHKRIETKIIRTEHRAHAKATAQLAIHQRRA